MYIALRIGGEEKEYASVTEGWIRDQLDRRTRDSQSLCVQLLIKGPSVDLLFSSPGCGSSGGGSRQLTPGERRALEIWTDMHMNTTSFTHGNVFAMLRRVHQALN